MSLRSEIYTLLSGDATITGIVSTNVYHRLLPDNFDNTATEAVVFEARIAEPTHTLSERELWDEYVVTIKAVSKTPASIDTLADAIKSAMQGYSSAAAQDVMFDRDNYVYDPDNELHTLSLDFTVEFCN